MTRKGCDDNAIILGRFDRNSFLSRLCGDGCSCSIGINRYPSVGNDCVYQEI